MGCPGTVPVSCGLWLRSYAWVEVVSWTEGFVSEWRTTWINKGLSCIAQPSAVPSRKTYLSPGVAGWLTYLSDLETCRLEQLRGTTIKAGAFLKNNLNYFLSLAYKVMDCSMTCSYVHVILLCSYSPPLPLMTSWLLIFLPTLAGSPPSSRFSSFLLWWHMYSIILFFSLLP